MSRYFSKEEKVSECGLAPIFFSIDKFAFFSKFEAAKQISSPTMGCGQRSSHRRNSVKILPGDWTRIHTASERKSERAREKERDEECGENVTSDIIGDVLQRQILLWQLNSKS